MTRFAIPFSLTFLRKDEKASLTFTNDHTARVLTQRARQVLNTHTELQVLSDAGVFEVEACILDGVGHPVRLAATLHWLTRPESRPSDS